MFETILYFWERETEQALLLYFLARCHRCTTWFSSVNKFASYMHSWHQSYNDIAIPNTAPFALLFSAQ